MAPLSAEACPLSVSSIPHFGPVIPEVCWSQFFYKNFIYYCFTALSALIFVRGESECNKGEFDLSFGHRLFWSSFWCIQNLTDYNLQVVSSWFRLFLYCTAYDGPISLYIPKGSRVQVLPRAMRRCKRLLLTTASHEPVIVPTNCCLSQLNDTLQTHAVFVQVCVLQCELRLQPEHVGCS